MIERLQIQRRGVVPLKLARGHFATNHSHINYYVDITFSNGYIVHHTGCFQSKGNQLLRDLFVEHFGLWHHRCYEDK